jgi:hypothetical protein
MNQCAVWLGSTTRSPRHSTIGYLGPADFEKKVGLAQLTVHETGSRPDLRERGAALVQQIAEEYPSPQSDCEFCAKGCALVAETSNCNCHSVVEPYRLTPRPVIGTQRPDEMGMPTIAKIAEQLTSLCRDIIARGQSALMTTFGWPAADIVFDPKTGRFASRDERIDLLELVRMLRRAN